MSLFEINNLKQLRDERGVLTILESEKDCPFSIERVYFLSNLKVDLPRGFHAHYKLWQYTLCLQGSFEMIYDDGVRREALTLDSSSKGVLIPPMIWHEMCKFSSDCLIMVVASDHYDEEDYIRNYDEFKRKVKSDS